MEQFTSGILSALDRNDLWLPLWVEILQLLALTFCLIALSGLVAALVDLYLLCRAMNKKQPPRSSVLPAVPSSTKGEKCYSLSKQYD